MNAVRLDFHSTVEPPKEAVLLVNNRSRRGKSAFADAERELLARGIRLRFSHGFRSVRELVSMTSEAIQEGVPMVIAGGGDGTFSAIAHLFLHKETVLGVLPLGTGNSFARDLNIPNELNLACDVIARGGVQLVDVGTLDTDCFVNVATIGLTTEIAQALRVLPKKQMGKFAYAFALARAMQTVHPFRARIETENGINEFETMMIVLGNGRFHAGPFPLSPDASIREGLLSVYALRARDKMAFLRLALRLPFGTQGDLEEVHAEETEGGTLWTEPVMAVTVDGEICRRTPSKFGVAYRALRVVAPLGADL